MPCTTSLSLLLLLLAEKCSKAGGGGVGVGQPTRSRSPVHHGAVRRYWASRSWASTADWATLWPRTPTALSTFSTGPRGLRRRASTRCRR